MPLLVVVDPLAFSRGWLGSAQRYFQLAKALGELRWDVAIVARRDDSRATREVDAAFPGQVFRTPFGTVPRLVDHWGLRHAWWLARKWSRREPGDDVWARRLTKWSGRYKPGSPLASASLLCAVSYFCWGTSLAARIMARELGIAYWIDIHDPLRGTTGTGRPNLSDDQLACLLDARQIVTTTAAYKAHLRDTLPEDADRIECLRLTHNSHASRGALAAPERGTIMLLYAGYLYGLPDLSAVHVLRAIARLYERTPSMRGRVVLRLIGTGRGIQEATTEADKLGLSRDLQCLPPVDPDSLRSYLDTADVLCLFMSATKRLNYQIPGKTYDYLFSNKPILAVVPPGELAEIIGETGSGFVVPPSETERLASILGKLLDQKLATGSVALERDAAKLSPYSFGTFRGELERVLAACLK